MPISSMLNKKTPHRLRPDAWTAHPFGLDAATRVVTQHAVEHAAVRPVLDRVLAEELARQDRRRGGWRPCAVRGGRGLFESRAVPVTVVPSDMDPAEIDALV